MLAGRGHRLDQLLRIAGLARSTYFYHLSHPERVTRADLEPLVGEIWGRTPNGCGHRQVRMCLVHEFGQRVSAKSVLRVMRRMGLRCAIRSRNPWKRYDSYRGETGDHVHNLLKRDFGAAR
ncbi:IS3 family transposase, partial [Bifidobacterium longum]